MVDLKQVIVEASTSMVSWNSIAFDGTEVGSEDKWRMKMYCRGNASLRDVPLNARVRITVEVLPPEVPL